MYEPVYEHIEEIIILRKDEMYFLLKVSEQLGVIKKSSYNLT